LTYGNRATDPADVPQRDPAEPQIRCGTALIRQGKFAEAAAVFRQAILLSPNNPTAFSNLAAALGSLGQLEQAIAASRQAIALKPDFAEAYSNLGVAFEKQGRIEDAIAAYHRSVSLRGDYARGYINLGSALRAQSKLDESAAAYRRAIVLETRSAHAYVGLGVVLQQQGEIDEALTQSSKKPRGSSSPENRAMMSQARSIAFSSMWASACTRAMRPATDPKARRFGISLGGRSAGRRGRAGWAGGPARPTAIVLRLQVSASARLAATFSAGSAVARIAAAAPARVV
jgi:Flp pilus assembly protein TadD